jgi:hypothetical protein
MKTPEEILQEIKNVIEDGMENDDAGFLCLYKSDLERILPELLNVLKNAFDSTGSDKHQTGNR